MTRPVEGKYLTRGRALEIERLIEDLRDEVNERLAVLEHEIAEAKRLAGVAAELPLELARRQIAGLLDGVKTYASGGGRNSR